MTRTWHERNPRRWESDDGAVVKIDAVAETRTARPWLPHYRGWVAYGPGPDQHNYIGFIRRNSRMKIPSKFKTASAAMKAVDNVWP